jgi:deazaflavin-dependent oxidoreductase (nitroreductase family)
MKRKIIFIYLFFHNFIYIYSNGRIGKNLNGRPCLILETVGAKTKLIRKNVLVYLKEGNEICLVASRGGSEKNPGWYHNLKNNKVSIISIGTEKFEVTSREVFNEERIEWWVKMDFLNNGGYEEYQKRTERIIPIMILTIT